MANEVAYGFIQLTDLFSDRVVEVGSEVVSTAVLETALQWNRMLTEVMDKLVMQTTMRETNFLLPSTGMLQPLDADGNPVPVRHTGSYEVGFPVRWAGTAFGTNRETRAKATVADYNRWTLESLRQDKAWLQRQILKALLYKNSWTFTDASRPQDTAVTVQPLANNDTVVYTRRDGTATTDNHYLGQAGAIADGANPFPTIFSELYEHPSNNLDQNGFVVVYVATSLEATIAALTNLQEVTNQLIIPGTQNDRVSDAILQYVSFGDKVIGYIDGCVIVRWSALPTDYMLAHAPMAGAVLAMREEPEPQLQGLITETANPDGNHIVERLLRKAGFGVINRVAAVAYYIGNGTYPNPAGFDPTKAE